MAGSRRWITRDEIADIYDSMADRVQAVEPKLGESTHRTADKNLVKANKLRARAADVRATERLSNPLGDRVA